MTPEELRAACEMAGLDCGPDGCFPEVDNTGDYTGPFMEWSNPALPAYVASVLVAKVRDQAGLDYNVDAGHPDVARVDFSDEPTAHGTTVTARGKADEWVVLTIRAAMEALSDE